MKDTFLKIWVAITAFLVAAVPIAMAATPGGASVVGTAQDKGEYGGTGVGTIAVDAGNIYLANVSGNMSTYHWAGIYGNATGFLILGDSSGNKMYEWTAKASYVFFDDDNTVAWTALGDATCTDVGSNFTFVADSTGSSDSCSNTFTSSGTPSFKSIPTAGFTSTIIALTYDNTGTGVWRTYAILDSTNSDVLFAAETDNTPGTAYDGTAANYQVILPEDGSNGNTATTTYYIWIELF